MTMKETGHRSGGLMRCCIQTLEDVPKDEVVRNGDVKKCNWCKFSMILVHDAWEWDRSEDHPQAQKDGETK